jgi:hypothetical protein
VTVLKASRLFLIVFQCLKVRHSTGQPHRYVSACAATPGFMKSDASEHPFTRGVAFGASPDPRETPQSVARRDHAGRDWMKTRTGMGIRVSKRKTLRSFERFCKCVSEYFLVAFVRRYFDWIMRLNAAADRCSGVYRLQWRTSSAEDLFETLAL